MDIQQIIALALGAVALYFVSRHIWAEVRGLIHPDEADACPGCGGCDAAINEQAPSTKSPLTTIKTTLPPHLERLRRSARTPEK